MATNITLREFGSFTIQMYCRYIYVFSIALIIICIYFLIIRHFNKQILKISTQTQATAYRLFRYLVKVDIIVCIYILY